MADPIEVMRASRDPESIRVDPWRLWLARSPFYFVVASITGVAVSFVPMELLELGRQGRGLDDFRVMALIGVQFVVLGIHVWLSAPIVRAARAARNRVPLARESRG